MTISELVDKLQALQSKHGDIEVWVEGVAAFGRSIQAPAQEVSLTFEGRIEISGNEPA